MEIKFNRTSCRHLRRAADQLQQREQTQEVRLPESMPDIGRVLGCWGQVLIRGKEWRSGGMSVSGGVMAWVLYAPEDGSEPRSLETWVPFQMKWEFPETERDGFICVIPRLKSIDARSTSARKLMVRANLGLWGQALESVETDIYQPEEVPQDVQILSNSYPMELAQEFGEKLFQLDEEMTPEFAAEKILRYELTPQIIEQKVMASRLVFRGKGQLRMLYLSDGKLCSWECEVPFSQFADLDRDYGPNSSARIIPVLTNLELDMAEGRLQLKAGLTAQFVVYDRVMVQLAEDAYSTVRTVQLHTSELNLPARLDQRMESIQVSQSVNAEAERIVDVCWLPDHPQRQQNGEDTVMKLCGMFQVLYYDPAQNLQCSTARYEQEYTLGADDAAAVDGIVHTDGNAVASAGSSIEISGAFRLETGVYGTALQQVLTGMELGQAVEPDPGRPSLILRRCGDMLLWDIAKECGSTVDAIRRANSLEGEPENGRMLLIPVC